MLSKRTTKKPSKPIAGACGGLGIWNIQPARHWCKMPDADMAMHVLAGYKMTWWSNLSPEEQQAAWNDGTIAIPATGGWQSVVLNSKCRWTRAQNAHTLQ